MCPFRERRERRGNGKLRFSFRRITLPMPLLRALVEAVASTRLATALPRIEAAIREARHLFPHLMSLWVEAVRLHPTFRTTRARPKPTMDSHRSKPSPIQVSSPQPPSSPLPISSSPPPPISPPPPPPTSPPPPPPQPREPTPPPRSPSLPQNTLRISLPASPPPTPRATSPLSQPPPLPNAPNPTPTQPMASPTTIGLVRILSELEKPDQTPPPPPEPIFAALGGYLAQAEAAALEKLQLKRDHHQQKKREGTQIARNGPRQARTAADRSAGRPVTRAQRRRPAWHIDYIRADVLGSPPNRRLFSEDEDPTG